MPMNRSFKEITGYDCPRGDHPRCNGDSHGIASTEWCFVVNTNRAALSLLMFTPYYPDTVTIDRSQRRFHCRNLAVCTSWPTNDASIAAATEAENCPYLGKCHAGDSWGLLGDEFMSKHFVEAAGQEQPETFWRAMEDFLVEHIEPLIRFVQREQCRCCGGVGVVDKEGTD